MGRQDRAHGSGNQGAHGSDDGWGNVLLMEAVETFLAFKSVRCSPNTLRDYGLNLRRWAAFVGDGVQLVEATADDVQRFLIHLRGLGRKPKTVRNAYTAISSFYSWASPRYGVEHVIRDNQVEPPRVEYVEVIPLREDEVLALLLALERTSVWDGARRRPARSRRPTFLRDRALVLMLLDTGARASEICNLLVRDVNLMVGSVLINLGKGGKSRTVYMGLGAREALSAYLRSRDRLHDDDPLFVTNRGRRLDRHALRKMLRKAGQRAGIHGSIYPHRLRHTFAISYLRNGGDIYTLQRMLGHSSLDMVRRYLAIAQVDVAEAHRRASPVDNWRL